MEDKEGKGGQMQGDRRLDLCGEDTTKYRDIVSKSWTAKIYIMLLTNVSPINLVKIEKENKTQSSPSKVISKTAILRTFYLLLAFIHNL